MTKKILKWHYYTPKKGTKYVTLMRFNEWITIYRGEVILAHESHHNELTQAGLIKCGGIKVYKTKKAALQGKDNMFIRPTE